MTHWDLQEGFYSRDPYVYPHRVSGSGENGGLKFEIWRSIAEVRNSSNFNKGFKLVVHAPSDIPQFDKLYYRFPLEKSATLTIRPSMVVTERLERYNILTRNCYYEGEKKLKMFKKYSRPNCHLECLANFTRDACKCVHFSMPRMREDRICSLENDTCYKKARRDLMKINMEDSLSTSESYEDPGKGGVCECLPTCTSLQYEGEISHDDIRYFGKYRKMVSFRSFVTIFFKDDDFVYAKRSELYGATDFIANFGGLLGLFLGVSILSIVEIIYFIAFRKLDTADSSGIEEVDSRKPSMDDVTTIASSTDIKPRSLRNGY